MSVILTFAKFASIILGSHGRAVAAIVYIKHRGKETLE